MVIVSPLSRVSPVGCLDSLVCPLTNHLNHGGVIPHRHESSSFYTLSIHAFKRNTTLVISKFGAKNDSQFDFRPLDFPWDFCSMVVSGSPKRWDR